MSFKKHFNQISDFLLAELLEDEAISINYSAEESYFMRFKDAKVRQNGFVDQIDLDIKFYKRSRIFSFSLSLHFNIDDDYRICAEALEEVRNKILLLPENPYYSVPTSKERSEKVFKGGLLSVDEIPTVILSPFKEKAFNGLYSQGKICRGVVASSGVRHWFETENFLLNYSVWLSNGRAVKAVYSGNQWNQNEYNKRVDSAISQLSDLSQTPKKIAPGKYRVFITPNALVDVSYFFHGFGARSLNDGSSAFIALKEGREEFSPKFNLAQDFTRGLEPAFNSDGELAPDKLVLVKNGKLENMLISNRSAKQFQLKANGAPTGEYTREISIMGGSLEGKDVLKALDTGIYISSFNYLNWSDTTVARVTGMTRHACMWVENGKPVCPIEDLRWDESLYNIFGKNLVDLTVETETLANSSTYGSRQTGSVNLPGVLVTEFNCTL